MMESPAESFQSSGIQNKIEAFDMLIKEYNFSESPRLTCEDW